MEKQVICLYFVLYKNFSSTKKIFGRVGIGGENMDSKRAEKRENGIGV